MEIVKEIKIRVNIGGKQLFLFLHLRNLKTEGTCRKCARFVSFPEDDKNSHVLQREAECLCAREDEVARSKTPTIRILHFISFIRSSSNGHRKYMKRVTGIKKTLRR